MKTETWKSADGTEIFARINPGSKESKGVIIQCHGLGEHSGRYPHVAEWFEKQGWAFMGYDHRGHGKTPGKRGHIPSYDTLMEELDIALKRANELYPDKKIWLYGHSWGGNIILNYLLRKNPAISGAIVTGPWLTLPPSKIPNGFMQFMAKVMNVIFPSLQNPNGLDLHGLSRDQAVIDAYKADKLVHNKISVRNFIECDNAAGYALENAGKLSIPTYLAHGSADILTNPEGSKQFAAAAKKDVLQFKLWKDWYHELHNEPEKEEFFQEVLNFMDQH